MTKNRIMYCHNRTDNKENQYSISYRYDTNSRNKVLFGIHFFNDGEQISKPEGRENSSLLLENKPNVICFERNPSNLKSLKTIIELINKEDKEKLELGGNSYSYQRGLL